MGAGRHRADDAEGGVFLKGDTVVAAACAGPEPFHARHQAQEAELLNFVLQTADFGLLKFHASPLHRPGVGEHLDDVHHPFARRDPFAAQLQKGVLRRRASLVGILKNAKVTPPAPGRATA